MPTLSASLGHAPVNDTFWSLAAPPELFHAVTQDLDTDREEKPEANCALVSPPLARILYRAAAAPTARESPHDCALPSHVVSPPAVCPATAAQGPVAAQPGGARRAVAQRLSGASGAGAGEPCQPSPCALGRAAFLLPLCRAGCPAVERRDPPGPGHPQHTDGADRHRLLDPPGERSTPGGPQSDNLDRTAGPDMMTDRGANRAARVATHGLAVSGRRAWGGSPCALLRPRTQGTLHPAAPGRGRGSAGVASRTPRWSCGPRVSHRPRRCAPPRRGRVSAGHTRGDSTAPLRLVTAEARHASCPAPYCRYGAPPTRRGPRGDCPVARTCIGGDHPTLSPCQSGTARASLGQNCSIEWGTRPLPTG
jgi:hypothetical protein